MKAFIITITSVLLLRGTLAPTDVYTLSSDYKFTILGTSNVHDWEESVNKVKGNGDILWNTDGTVSISSMEIVVDVKSIKSTNGAIMDNKTHDALKVESYPTITFKLTKAINTVKPGSSLSAHGELKIAGVSKPVDLQVKVSGNASKVIFEGSRKLDMTEFGIKPPTAFVGAMRVGNEVTVKFRTAFTATPTIQSSN